MSSTKFTVFNLYEDRWVLCSAERVIGGGTVDAPPVRLVAHDDREGLVSVLKELLSEEHPVVPEPDWDDERFMVGIRVEAVGLKSWPAFVNRARCFHLEGREDGDLLLEEWPREGRSFGANAAWKKKFPGDAIDKVVDHLARVTGPEERRGTGRKKPTKQATPRRTLKQGR